MKLVDHLDKLKAFKIVAETGKLGEAASKLNLTQPSLTRLIQTLESATNQTLLHRSRQGVVLTQAGKQLLHFAAITLKNLEDFEEQLLAPNNEISGLLQIGSYESLAEYLWPDFLPLLKKIHPSLKITIRTSSEFVHQRKLESGELDLLVDAEPRLVGDFTSWALYEDRFNFYGKKGIVPATLTNTEIKDMTLVYQPTAYDSENRNILNHLEEAGYHFKEKIELDSFVAVTTFVKSGVGIGVIPQRLAETHVATKHISPISLKGISAKGFGSHTIYATVRSSSIDDKRIRTVVKALREEFKK